MNRIAIVPQSGNPRFDIHVDGKRLAEHFVGQHGAHPSNVTPLGWQAASPSAEKHVLQQLLGQAQPDLPSGRIALLVCEECGDLACGALAARISCSDHVVTWSDWAYENGYEPASNPSWPNFPATFEFDRAQYEDALSNVTSNA